MVKEWPGHILRSSLTERQKLATGNKNVDYIGDPAWLKYEYVLN